MYTYRQMLCWPLKDHHLRIVLVDVHCVVPGACIKQRYAAGLDNGCVWFVVHVVLFGLVFTQLFDCLC